MEDLEDRVNSLPKISEYKFKAESVKNIMKALKVELSEEILKKTMIIDKKHHPVYIQYEKLIKIIDDEISNDKFFVKFSTEKMIDGYRKYLCFI